MSCRVASICVWLMKIPPRNRRTERQTASKRFTIFGASQAFSLARRRAFHSKWLHCAGLSSSRSSSCSAINSQDRKTMGAPSWDLRHWIWNLLAALQRSLIHCDCDGDDDDDAFVMEFNAFNGNFRIYIIDGGQAQQQWEQIKKKECKLARKLSRASGALVYRSAISSSILIVPDHANSICLPSRLRICILRGMFLGLFMCLMRLDCVRVQVLI